MIRALLASIGILANHVVDQDRHVYKAGPCLVPGKAWFMNE